ncbi:MULTISPECIES: hypothetical protein [unclassified Mycobacterium]|uniref:hypothetical protein n=1 Tax=unclassified Mycobacterium TaxID=2642494 RepID=UPI0006DCE51A|nr:MULTISPECIES: hypothetical protein [unclassified Mycobacterium]
MATTTADSDVERLLKYIDEHIPEMFGVPGLWPGNVELALIDAVLSIRARYGTSSTTGVRGAVKRYEVASGRDSWDDLKTLAEADPTWLQEVLANKQKTGGVTKPEVIRSAAERLLSVGARHAADIDRNSTDQRGAYCGTKGLGPVTWAYFTMLLGHDGVKADTLVTRFVELAIGRKVGSEECARLVTEAANRLDMPATALDHSIWRYMSDPRKD